MAAGDSPTSIANLALAMVGEEAIANVNPPDNNKQGRLCRQFYDTSRRAMLAAAPWREAKRQVSLPAAATPPGFTYAYAYTLPANFIRFFELPEDETTRWELMNLDGSGLCIATDAGPPLEGTIIVDLDDCRLMSPLLVKAIAADMAVMMAWPLARDISLKNSVAGEREAYLSLARTVSAQQASSLPFDADLMLRSRW